MKRRLFWSKREVCFHFVPQHVTNLAMKLFPKNRALAEEKLKTTGKMIYLPTPIGQGSDHFEEIYQMESSMEIIIFPKMEKKKQKQKPPTKQKVKKAKRKGGTNSFYLWSRGNSKKTNEICKAKSPNLLLHVWRAFTKFTCYDPVSLSPSIFSGSVTVLHLLDFCLFLNPKIMI